VQVWRGEWERAEQELQRLVRDFATIAPVYSAIAHVELAELRCRQGRFAEALALLEGDDALPLAHLVRARVALDQGRFAPAMELAERYLRRLGPGESLRRAGGLAVRARALARLGDLAAARAALDEIAAMARAAATVGMRAVAAATAGEVALAAGDLGEARRALEDACDLYGQSGAPFEAACSRVELARCLAAAGRPDEATAEARAAVERLRELGAGPRADEVARQLLAAAAPAGDERPAALASLSERELEVLAEVAGGRSNDEIARRLHLSVHTVKRHVANLLAKLDLPSRTAAASLAVRCGVSPSP
jgi:ATP/maltotriose-dependent transcriptional regulator MalT